MNRTARLSLTPSSRSSADTEHAIERAIGWRTWEEGQVEAQRRGVPILALAEPWWTNAAQRLALVIGRETRLKSALEDRVVPVLVDPCARPDLVDCWRVASIRIAGSIGPPLLVYISHDGAPLIPYPSIIYEGAGDTPSLASVAIALSERYPSIRDELRHQSLTLDARRNWLADDLDCEYGGIVETPKLPHPQALLHLVKGPPGARTDDWLRLTLRAMRSGGIYDQLDRGFHRAARDDRWIAPHFEKPVPLNAQLAAVYAAAAGRLGDDSFAETARQLDAFCRSAVERSIDAIASDSAYYTWTSSEVLTHVARVNVQAISLHFGIAPSSSRQALREAVDLGQMTELSLDSEDQLSRRLEAGRQQLLTARRQRPEPALVSLPMSGWALETIRWLLEARLGDTAPLERALDRICQGIESAPLRVQVSSLAASLAAYDVTGNERWRRNALHVGALLGSGNLNEIAGAVVDDVVPAAAGTAAMSLATLFRLTGDPLFEDARSALRTRVQGTYEDLGPRSISLQAALADA